MGDCFHAHLTDAERKELHTLILARCVFHCDPSRETDCGVSTHGVAFALRKFRISEFGLSD